MTFNDYTVLDLTRFLPGPYATMLFGDLGMDVIKIEEPSVGDGARWAGPELGDTGLSKLFHSLNRNKRSVAIDLSADEGQAAFLELAKEADVVFEQFRPGVVDRLGIGYEDVSAVNDEIIYCSLTGYGQTGPYQDRPGHDLNYSAIAGLIDQTRTRDTDDPAHPGYLIGDMVSGLLSAFALMSALFSKELGNGGQYLDLSMTEAVLTLVTGQEWAATTESIPDDERRPPVDLNQPCHNIYQTKDGEHVTIACIEEKFWEAFLEAIDRPDLWEYQFATGTEREYAIAEIEAEFQQHTRNFWTATLAEDIPYAPVNQFESVFDDPQIAARDIVNEVEIDGETVRQLGFPMQTSADIDSFRSPAPQLGEHTRSVLETVLPSGTIDELDADDVIRTG